MALARQISEEDVVAIRQAGDHAIVALVASWSLDTPITLDTVVDLPGEDYDALFDAAVQRLPALMPNFTAPDTEPESPTDA